jgi:large subunit ribosomal protein L17
MRHKVFGRKLSRDRNERQSLFKGLISSLIIHGNINTTETRAKAIRGLVDKLVTKAKKGSVDARRLIGAFIQDKKVANKLVDEIAVKFEGRPGGYTRMTRIGKRVGDNAPMVKLEFVEGKEVKVEKKENPVVKGEVVKEEKKKVVKAKVVKSKSKAVKVKK